MGWQRVIVVGGEETIALGDHATTDPTAWDAPGEIVTEAAARDWFARKKASHIRVGYELVEHGDSFSAVKTRDDRTKRRTILIREV
jgi:hypothetical protein